MEKSQHNMDQSIQDTFYIRDHNERCIAYAVGCAVQNVRDIMKGILISQAIYGSRSLAISYDPWNEGNIIGIGIGYLESGTCDCFCEMTEEDFAKRPLMLETLTLGFVAIRINNNPDVTNRV